MTSTLTRADTPRRKELATFLRSRRERIAPEQVGVTFTGRRRTPGLRREEVAQLSGVGVTWYTWLEQGRDINVSEQVLEAIARSLLLDRAERQHLFTLAGASESPVARECGAVNAQQRAMLAKLDPYPAALTNGRYDLLAYNRAYRFLIADLDELALEDRNSMWLIFTDPRWRRAIVDWEEGTTRMVANFRGLMADHVAEGPWKALVTRLLAASPEFAELWARHDVAPIENKVKRIRHPRAGLLTFHATNTWTAPRAGGRMLVYVPADAQTEKRITVISCS